MWPFQPLPDKQGTQCVRQRHDLPVLILVINTSGRLCVGQGCQTATIVDQIGTCPSGKLPFECQKIAKNLTFKNKN